MIGSQRNKIYDEQPLNNPHDIIEIKNKQKITLRKKKLNENILNKRKQNLAENENDLDINIKPEMKFKIKKFEDSYELIFSYLKSNNIDLIKYSLKELNIYFMYNDPSVEEQKIIFDNQLLKLLLKLGNTFIEDKDKNKNKKSLYNLLYILINIQACQTSLKDYFIDLYSKEYFEFYNKCMIILNDDKEIYNLIRLILKYLCKSDDYFNLELLRSDVFSSILDYYENQNMAENDDKKLTLELINYSLDLSNLELLVNKKDINIICRCLNILANDINGTHNEELLCLIYKGLYEISDIDMEYKFNKRIIESGVTFRILKFKFASLKLNNYIMRLIDYSLRIIANNLTSSDSDCQLIYDQNIIDYYNNILRKFDDCKIVRDILAGIENISAGSKRNILLHSAIWDEKNIQKFCNLCDSFKMSYIKIVRNMVYHADYDILKFIYNTKILQYFLFLTTNINKNQIIFRKICRLIMSYLRKFNNEQKKNEEFQFIFHKFKEIMELSEIKIEDDNFDIDSFIEENEEYIKNDD